MTDKQIRKMILAILNEADYDLAKSFDPNLSEDPESSEATMRAMVKIAAKHIRVRVTEEPGT